MRLRRERDPVGRHDLPVAAPPPLQKQLPQAQQVLRAQVDASAAVHGSRIERLPLHRSNPQGREQVALGEYGEAQAGGVLQSHA
jgi:hypothetical protein